MNDIRPLQTIIDASCESLVSTAAMMEVSLTKEMASVESLEEIIKALVDLGDETRSRVLPFGWGVSWGNNQSQDWRVYGKVLRVLLH